MRLTLDEIREKEVVNTTDGTCFGFADDIVIDTETKEVVAIVIRGKLHFFGIFGREEDAMIGWDEIQTIGNDIILVKTTKKLNRNSENGNIFQKFLSIFL